MSKKLPPRVLVIEQNDIASTAICNMIERCWFNVDRVNNPHIAHKIASTTLPNVVIISTKLESMNPIKLARTIQSIVKLSKVPFIFLANDGEKPEDYFLGPDAYVELVYRNFTPNQLITVIKTLLRRSQPIFQDKIIRYKDISIDLATYKTFRGDKEIHIGPTEFKILQLFIQAPQTIYSREQIIDYVWGLDKMIEPRTVDVHVNRLRNMMKINNNDLPFIKTVRSSGYCLNVPGEVE